MSGPGRPWQSVVGRHANGRTVVQELVEHRGNGTNARRVIVVCDTCDSVSEVSLHTFRRCGCASCSAKSRGRISTDGRRSYRDLMAQCGEECPELWRNHTASDRETTVAATVVLVGKTGPMGTDEVGALMGLSRQRIQQIQDVALKKLRLKFGKRGRDMLDELNDVHDYEPTLWADGA